MPKAQNASNVDSVVTTPSNVELTPSSVQNLVRNFEQMPTTPTRTNNGRHVAFSRTPSRPSPSRAAERSAPTSTVRPQEQNFSRPTLSSMMKARERDSPLPASASRDQCYKTFYSCNFIIVEVRILFGWIFNIIFQASNYLQVV
jgi:hypothetical protein